MLLHIFLILLPATPAPAALQSSSCIKYETYITKQYRMTPLNFSDSWFSHRIHYSPRRKTRIGFRSRKILGCCETGYMYMGFPSYGCHPICTYGCQINAHCSAPDICSCDDGYIKNSVSGECISKKIMELETTPETSTTVLMKTTSSKIPCNGSCLRNEICSSENDVCMCQNGFHRPVQSSSCVPKCDNGCQNADCTSPNKCTCWPHYNRTNDSSCHLQCNEQSCIFGECNENGDCICADGFVNNGTSCLWADDVFSEPDYCECWSKFHWKTNLTQNRCLISCNDIEVKAEDVYNSKEISQDCIPFKECDFYEGYTICHTQMYKCINVQHLSTTLASHFSDKKHSDSLNSKESKKFVVLEFFVGGLTLFLIGVLMSTLVFWKIRSNWFTRIWSYNIMDNALEQDNV